MIGSGFLLSLATTIATKLPIAFMDRWLNYLEKKADTDTARLESILGEQIEAKRLATSVIIAEQDWWVTRAIRPAFAYPAAIYSGKILLWDKVLGWGATDPLEGEHAAWVGAIVLAYFVVRPGEKWVKAILRGK